MDPVQEQEDSSAYETLFGGVLKSVRVANHETRRLDTEDVRIRQLPVGTFPKAFQIHANEEQMVALYADRPVEWVQRLHPASYNLIAQEGRRLNVDFFAYCDRQAKSQMEEVRRVAPELHVEILRKVADAADKLASAS